MSNLPLESIQWQRQGQWQGGLITCVAAHGPVCLAGGVAGLFRSVDAGKTWARVHDELGYEASQAVALMNAHAYAATQAGRLLHSHDAGTTWQPLSSWLYGVIQCLACAITREGQVALFVGTANGVYRSLDAGQSWQEANFGLLDTDVLCLACAPDFADSEMVMLGTAQGGLYRSRNAGRAWRESGDGLADAAVLCVVLSPKFAEDRTALVGLEGQGLFQSVDGGQHWEAHGLDGQDVHAIVHSGATAAWLAGTSDGVYECVDQSAPAWQPLPQVAGVTSATLAHADDGGDVPVVGTLDQGTLQLGQRSEGWHVAGGDGIAAHVPPLVAATDSGTLFAIDNTGLAVHSADGGATWVRCLFDEALGDDFPKLLSARGNAVVLLVGAHRLYQWDADRATFFALADVPMADDDEVTVVAVDAHTVIWVGSRNGHLQRRWPESGLWEALPAPVAGMLVGLHGAVNGADVDVDAAIVRSTPDGRYTAELWRLAQSASAEKAWTMALALDHLPQPFACLAVGAGRGPIPTTTMVLAAHNMLAIHSANAAPRLVDLGPETRITALLPFEGGWWVATNRGVCFVNENAEAPIETLVDRPVVALLKRAECLIAVTLGGEIWSLSPSNR